MPTDQIRFSIVSAVYDVARYLDAFIDSIEGQDFPRDRFEVIAVNDGSTDESLQRLQAWEASRPGLVRVVSQENAGLGGARNAGLPLVRGQWVSFADPDDVLPPNYLSEVAAFLDANPSTAMVGTSMIFLDDATGELSDTHPTRNRFAEGNVLRDLTRFPGHVFGSAPAAFMRTDEIRRQRLEFDTRVRPHFEDGHFCIRYLLGVERPTVGLVATARYHYRKRSDGSSLLQGSLAHPGRYTDVLRHGYLDILRRGAAQESSGMPPEFVQNIVIYELSWYFSTQDRPAGAVTAAVGPVADEFHRLMAEIRGLLAPDVIASFSMRRLKPEWREILLHAYEPEPWRSHVALSRLDVDQGLARISYRYTGDQPREELFSGDAVVAPHHAKVREFEYHGRVLLHERIAWISASSAVGVRLDGDALEVQPATSDAGLPRLRRRSIRGRLIRWLAASSLARRRFGGAWVLMDRVHDAGDSGEILFRHLRTSEPTVSAWFVIEAGTADYRRLRSEFGGRVVAHGSTSWKLLMANCAHLISSHTDEPIVRPPALRRVGKPRWRFTFLQHGVIKDDISGWLNAKPIDLFITSTPQEQASIAGDRNRYVFTTKEVKLTGIPRFDRLLEVAGRIDEARRDIVLVAPTWRQWLFPPLPADTQRRELDPAALESEFVRCWRSLLGSPELEALCRAEGLTLGFLAHPNLQPAVPLLRLPPHVRPLTFHDGDVQEHFARAAMMVTDYSSMAFNAAYLNRPVVYFQFDRDRVLGGEHVGRRGYFDYESDGFGPVATSVDAAVRAMTETLRAGRRPAPEFQARIDAAFPLRDGKCSERVTEEIRRSTRPASVEPHAEDAVA